MLKVITKRRGVTLLELLVVVILVGIFSSIVVMRFGRSLFSEFGAQSDSRIVSLALLQAQRAAIATGDNHYVEFDGTTATNFQIVRRGSGSDTVVDGPHDLSADVTITVSHTQMEFNFEGQALAAYVADLVGVDRSWQISTVPITGAVSVVETTP
jgi:prepilin-type N-terminal cleavage/methylation domain-containing protein